MNLIQTTTRIETRSQRARLPKTSARSMFEEFSSRSIAARGTGASFSSETLDISLGRGRPTRGTTNTGSFSTNNSIRLLYPYQLIILVRPPFMFHHLITTPYAYASSAPAAASLIMSTSMPTSYSTTTISNNIIITRKSKIKRMDTKSSKKFSYKLFFK